MVCRLSVGSALNRFRSRHARINRAGDSPFAGPCTARAGEGDAGSLEAQKRRATDQADGCLEARRSNGIRPLSASNLRPPLEIFPSLSFAGTNRRSFRPSPRDYFSVLDYLRANGFELVQGSANRLT